MSVPATRDRSRSGLSGLETLVALAIILLVAFIAFVTFVGLLRDTAPAPPTASITGRFVSAPSSVPVDGSATFVLRLQQPPIGATADALVPVPGVGVFVRVVPSAALTIRSINGTVVEDIQGGANTDANGEIRVVVSALAEAPLGALVAVLNGRTTELTRATFEIFQP